MKSSKKLEQLENHPEVQSASESHPSSSPKMDRRDLLKMAIGAGAGLALGDIVDLSTVRAAAQQLKLANVHEFTTS